jgi:plasmid stabilization system protein ParE
VSFRVRLTRKAEADLNRLFDFVLERELTRDGGDLNLADKALNEIRAGLPH